VVEAGLRGPAGDAYSIRDLGQGQPEVVVENEHGSLLERQPPEGSFELVAIVDGQDVVRLTRSVDREETDVGRPPGATPGLGVALIGQDPMEPGLEEIGIAKRSQLPPGHDEGRLNGVLGQGGVAQDPARDRHASIADLAGEGVEGLLVAPLRSVHEISMHPFLLAPRPVRLDAITWERVAPVRKVQSPSFTTAILEHARPAFKTGDWPTGIRGRRR